MVEKTITPKSAPPSAEIIQPSDFRKEYFDAAIWQKGYEVIVESAIECACKSEGTNQQSNCKNCGGTGWFFVNAVKTRAIITSMNINTKYKAWSKELQGNFNITTQEDLDLAFMDRVTVLDGKALFSQAIHIKKVTPDILFSFCSYNIKKMIYAGIFVDTQTKYAKLKEGVDFTFKDDKFFLDQRYLSDFNTRPKENPMSLSLKYVHAPQYHIIDMPREIMNSWTHQGSEELIKLPVHAIGRRAHYVLDQTNIADNNIIDNSYPIDP